MALPASRNAARTSFLKMGTGPEHHMRCVAFVLAILLFAEPVLAAVPAQEIDPRASLGVVQQWIYNYRAKPDYAHIPAAVRVLFHAQTFKEPENAGIYLGFIAGALASNPAKAEQLLNSFFPVPAEDEWVIIRAIAFSGLPDWRGLLRRIAPKMPGRQVMIDAYLAGSLPTLTDIPLEEKQPGAMDKVKAAFTKNPFAKDEKKMKMKPNVRGQPGSARYALGLLFRDRLLPPDPAHHGDAAMEQEPRHRRQAHRRQHGALYAGKLRGARCEIARISPQRIESAG